MQDLHARLQECIEHDDRGQQSNHERVVDPPIRLDSRADERRVSDDAALASRVDHLLEHLHDLIGPASLDVGRDERVVCRRVVLDAGLNHARVHLRVWIQIIEGHTRIVALMFVCG